jgi:hypothetical protein
MKNHLLLLFVVLFIGLGPISKNWGSYEIDNTLNIRWHQVENSGSSEIPDAIDNMKAIGSSFIENVGQIENGDVRFYANGNPLSVGLTQYSIVLSLQQSSADENNITSISSVVDSTPVVISISFKGCNRVEPRGMVPSLHNNNFFLGNDPDGWARNVKSYTEVMYGDIYNGIDLRFYFKDGMFKYDFMVESGIDPSIIQLRYDGIDGLTTDPQTSDLLIHTSAGTVRDMRPVILQDLHGVGKQVHGDFQLSDDRSIGFVIPDEISGDRSMVIDPGLLFSTYLGGSENDFGTSIGYDDDGNIYVAGYTDSPDFPTTSSAPYPDFIGGDEDVFIAKLDPTCSILLFATYLGGSDVERTNEIEVLLGDSLCVVGYTESTDFPIAGNALSDTFLGTEDGFILSLSLNGSVLQYSSYLGGNRKDHARAIEVGYDGSVYVFGLTYSPDLPTTLGAYRRSQAGIADVFAYKLRSSLDGIVYCTYIGGALYDGFMDASVADDGTSYIVGITHSEDFPLTSDAFCSTRGGNPDSFAVVLNSTGDSLLHSTLLAGDETVSAYSVAVDRNGRVYVVGETNATDFPVTPDAIKSTVSGIRDIFLTVLDGALSSLAYSTLIGGSVLDYEPRLTYTLGKDTVYLSGRTTSSDLETTSDAFDPLYRGESDTFIAGLNTTSFKVQYLTYLGGDKDEHPMDLRSDDKGNLYITGYTRSTDYPTTRGVYCQTFDPGQYLVAFASILAPGPCKDPPGAPHGLRAEVGIDSITLYWEPTIADGARVHQYNLYRGTAPGEEVLLDSVNATMSIYYDDEVHNGIRYYYRLSAESTVGEGPLSGVVTARILGPPTEALNLTLSTGNGTVTLQWEPPLGPGGDQLRYRVLMGETRNDLVVIEASLDEPFHIVTDVEIGKFYYYAIRTFCEHGDGPLSEVLRIKALDTPSQPRGFQVTPGDGKVSLSWNLPASDGGTMIIGFHIWKGTDPSNVNLFATLSSTQLSHADADVVNGRSYFYYVTAFSEVGDGRSTTVVDANPFGLPGAVESLVATAGDSQVTLNWTTPAENGRPITKFKVYAGESTGSMELLTTLGNFTEFVHMELENGVNYYYKIAAMNEAGEGPISDTVSARPMGSPGPATDLVVVNIPSGIKLTWKAPTDLGGADSVTYRVMRGESDSTPEPIAEITDLVEFLDDTTELGVTYHYLIQTTTSFAEGPQTDVVQITAATVPDIVTNLVTTNGNGTVDLAWDPPLDDGASPIVEYIVRRGVFVTGMVEISRVTGRTNYTDSGLTNGKTYYYTVQAINEMGPGPQSDAVEGIPMGPPGQPGLFKAEAKGKSVILTWTTPLGKGMAPVTGYLIYRGVGSGDMELLAELAQVVVYTDEDVKKGTTYRYQVIATSSGEEGPPTEVLNVKIKESNGSPGPGTAFSLLALVIVAALALGIRRHRKHHER